jgi:hypothetical protein
MIDCNVEHPCWEQSTNQWYARVTQRDIDLARALVQFRAATLGDMRHDLYHDPDSLAKLETAVRLLRQLVNTQWREMVRQPFKFKTHSVVVPPTSTKATLDDLA